MNDPLKCIIVHMYKWEKAVYEKVAFASGLNKYAHNFMETKWQGAEVFKGKCRLHDILAPFHSTHAL